jgi:hypothetical protein
VADSARLAAGAHHRDGGRREQGPKRVPLSGALPQVQRSQGEVVGVGRDANVQDTRVVAHPRVGSQPGDDPQHPGVRGQHVADDLPDADLPGVCGKLLQQQRADPAAVPVIGDELRELGPI